MLDLIQLLPKQHFTQPPPRYTDASLIRALEEYGIGRPSTYAPILTTLLQRSYVEREDKKLIPTELGFIVNDLLVEFFSDIVNVDFTAEMEEKLDQVATGEQEWVPMLHEFYEPFAQTGGGGPRKDAARRDQTRAHGRAVPRVWRAAGDQARSLWQIHRLQWLAQMPLHGTDPSARCDLSRVWWSRRRETDSKQTAVLRMRQLPGMRVGYLEEAHRLQGF